MLTFFKYKSKMISEHASVEGFDYISKGSYAKVYGNDTVAMKVYIDYWDFCIFSVLREGLLLHKLGPQFLGVLNDKNGVFKGLVMKRAAQSMSKISYNSSNTNGILKIFRDVLGDLCTLHAKGLVHGDIKPANLLIMPNGVGTLCDFGLTSYAASEGPCPGLVEEMYTPMFRSPELLDKTPPYDVNFSDDIWSFGMTMYCTFIAVALRHKSEEVPSLHMTVLRDDSDERRALFKNRLLGLHNSDTIADLLSMCLHPNPAMRPSAADLYVKLTFVSQEFFLAIRDPYVPSDDFLERLTWCVPSGAARVTVPQSAFASCSLIAKNIWAVVHIIYLTEDNPLLKACLELFALLKNEDWSTSKCAVIASVLCGSLVRRSARFQSTWCSKMAGCSIAEYEQGLGRALSIAIANPEWSPF